MPIKPHHFSFDLPPQSDFQRRGDTFALFGKAAASINKRTSPTTQIEPKSVPCAPSCDPETTHPKTALIYVDVQRLYCDLTLEYPYNDFDRTPFYQAAERISLFDKQTDFSGLTKIMILMKEDKKGMEPFGLSRDNMTRVFEKQDLSGFSNPALNDYLQKEGIQRLLLAGVARYQCVLCSGLDAASNGYNVEILLPLTGHCYVDDEDMHDFGEAAVLILHAGTQANLVNKIIWRNGTDTAVKPTPFLDSKLNYFIHVARASNTSIISAFHFPSKNSAQQAAHNAYTLFRQNKDRLPSTNSVSPTVSLAPWMNEPSVFSQGDEHIMITTMTHHSPLRQLVEASIGKPHSYVVILGLG